MNDNKTHKNTIINRMNCPVARNISILLCLFTVFFFLSCPDTSDPPVPDSPLEYCGVSLAGAEFGEDSIPGTFNTDYTYPDPEYVPGGYDSVDYFTGKNMNIFRIPFRWERLQRTLNGSFDTEEQERLTTTVTTITGKGAFVILDPHNYARYIIDNTEYLIGTTQVTAAHFRDFWNRLADLFKSNANVIFGLMNEPYDMVTEDWVSYANEAIAGIRETGATNLILIQGNSWSGAFSWTANWYGTSNAIAMLDITDAGNNYAFEVHQYLDDNSAGDDGVCMSTSIGSERLADFTTWCRTNNKKGFLGEFGASSDNTCLEAIDDMVTFLEQNSDVWIGWTYWAAGPWWGDYFMSLEPEDGNDQPQMDILEEHL